MIGDPDLHAPAVGPPAMEPATVAHSGDAILPAALARGTGLMDDIMLERA